MFMLQKKKNAESAAQHQLRITEQKQRAKFLQQQKKKSKKQNDSFTQKTVAQRVPKNASDCIRYNAMYEDGLCEIEPGLYSIAIKFDDINYQLARESDQINTFSRYCELLNTLSPDVHFQLCLTTQRLDMEDFQQQVFMPKASEVLEPYRNELNQIIYNQAVKGQNGLVRNKYLVLSVHADNQNEARRLLSPVESSIRLKLKGLRSPSELQNGIQRLRVIQQLLQPDVRMNFEYRWLLTEKTLTTKDFVCPSSFNFRPQHDDSAAVYNDRFSFGGKVGKVVYLRDIAPELADDFLARLSKLEINTVLSLHVDAIPQHEAVELIKTKLAFMNQEAGDAAKQAAKQGIPSELGVRFELRGQIDEAEQLLDKLQNRNQRLFRTTLLVYTYADTNEKLDEQIKQIYATAQERTCRMDTLEFQQQDALNSILPLGKKHIELTRTLTTSNTAIFMPFTTQELFQPSGCYEGVNQHSKNLILCDRKLLAAGNGLVSGVTGSGKSMTVKKQILSILINYPDDDVIVLDPDGEYGRIADALDGTLFHVSAGSGDFLNPMDINIDYNDGKDPLIVKSQFLMSFCDLISDNGITAGQKTLIDKAAKATYSNYFAHTSREQMPTLVDFYENLKKLGPAASELIQNLGIYVDGTLDIFAHQSTIDPNSRFVVYSLQGIGRQLMTPGMMVVLDQISNRMTRNRALGKRTWVFIDEIQLLFLNDYCSEYFFSWSGIVRKWGGIITSITQHIETLLATDNGRRMLGDCQYVKLLNQHANDREHLGRLYNLSDEELASVTDADIACGLLKAGTVVVPFDDTIPSDTKLYALINTDPGQKTGGDLT